ncbi:TPA: hypothetical protein QDB04_000509 [Burkholderia vietnamiensis]|nr:hypothetical protein [Burkholderia vietnamiensis]
MSKGMHFHRQRLANLAYESYSFGRDVEADSGWTVEGDCKTWSLVVFVAADDPKDPSLKNTLVVRFNDDGTIEDVQAYHEGNPVGMLEGGVPSLGQPPQTLSFDDWMARVEQELGTEEVNPDSFGAYYWRGLTPAEAVLEDRIAAGVLPAADTTPAAVRTALAHVRSIYPQVTQVLYGRDGRWHFVDDEFEAPEFKAGDGIDTGIMEDAARAVETLPAAFSVSIEEVPLEV